MNEVFFVKYLKKKQKNLQVYLKYLIQMHTKIPCPIFHVLVQKYLIHFFHAMVQTYLFNFIRKYMVPFSCDGQKSLFQF